MNEYIQYIKEEGLRKFFFLILLLAGTVILAVAIVKGGILIPFALIALPFGLAMLYSIFVNARIGIIVTLIIGYIANGLGRYISNAPFGLLLDFLLILTLVSALFSLKPKDWQRVQSPVMLLVFIWFLFTVFEIFNPQATGFEPWFYAVRGIALYMIFMVPLVLLLFNKEKDFDLFITIWFIGALISSLYGMKQLYMGLDSAEKAWMQSGGAKTHLLFGRLRVFSFYSDAGQFGAFMGFTSVVAGVLALRKTKTFMHRIFYVATALLCFWGLAISGTRGALFVPLSGIFMYFFLSKNFKVVVLGFVAVGTLFFILKFTFIGQGNYQIQRMRSALDPQDASFQVRLENQKKFRAYLSDKPFGGGIGTAGYWGQRFSPGTFLAETPTDSHYVRIWAETGVVGLTVHLGVLLTIFGIAFFRIYNMKDPVVKQKMMAIYAGTFGILVASYGNQIMGQMPTNVYFYMSLAFLYLGPQWEKEKNNQGILSNK